MGQPRRATSRGYQFDKLHANQLIQILFEEDSLAFSSMPRLGADCSPSCGASQNVGMTCLTMFLIALAG